LVSAWNPFNGGSWSSVSAVLSWDPRQAWGPRYCGSGVGVDISSGVESVIGAPLGSWLGCSLGTGEAIRRIYDCHSYWHCDEGTVERARDESREPMAERALVESRISRKRHLEFTEINP